MGTPREGGLQFRLMIGRHLARNAVAYLALFVATSGTAYAAATIGSAQVVDNSLRSVDLRDGVAVRGVDVANRSLTGIDIADGTLTGADVKESSLTEVPRATLAGRKIDYGKVVASGAHDQKVVLAFRGIELRALCNGSSKLLRFDVRSTHGFTSLDYLMHRGATSALDGAVASQHQLGFWLSTSGADVGVSKFFEFVDDTGSNRHFYDMYLQWSGGTMTVRLVAKVFANANGTTTCFVAGTATSGA